MRMRSKRWREEDDECGRFAADTEMRVKRRACKVEGEREREREGRKDRPPAVAAAAAEIGCLTSV